MERVKECECDFCIHHDNKCPCKNGGGFSRELTPEEQIKAACKKAAKKIFDEVEAKIAKQLDDFGSGIGTNPLLDKALNTIDDDIHTTRRNRSLFQGKQTDEESDSSSSGSHRRT